MPSELHELDGPIEVTKEELIARIQELDSRLVELAGHQIFNKKLQERNQKLVHLLKQEQEE